MGKRAKIALIVIALVLGAFLTVGQLYIYPSVTVERLVEGDGPSPVLAFETEYGPAYRRVLYHDGEMERNAGLDKDAENIGSYNYKDHYLMRQKEAEGYTDGFLLEDGNYLFVRSTAADGGPKADIYSPSLELISGRAVGDMELENAGEDYRVYRSYLIDEKLCLLLDKGPAARSEYYYLVCDARDGEVELLELITVNGRLPGDNWHVAAWTVEEG